MSLRTRRVAWPPAFGTTLRFSPDTVEIGPQGTTPSYGAQFKPISRGTEVAPICGIRATGVIDAIGQGVVLDQLELLVTNDTPRLELEGLYLGSRRGAY